MCTVQDLFNYTKVCYIPFWQKKQQHLITYNDDYILKKKTSPHIYIALSILNSSIQTSINPLEMIYYHTPLSTLQSQHTKIQQLQKIATDRSDRSPHHDLIT